MFYCGGVIRSSPYRLKVMALLVVEDAAQRAGCGVIERTWGLRLALAYLSEMSEEAAECAATIWCAVVDPYENAYSESAANTRRASACTPALNTLYREAGVLRSGELMSRATPKGPPMPP